jgi:chemotaxis protein MotB
MSQYDDDHQDESFFVSMTDIMVGLLFIFILIIMFFAIRATIETAERKRLETENAVLTTFIEEEGVQQYTQLTAYQTYIGLQRTNLLNWISGYLEQEGIEGVQKKEY